MIIDSAAPAHRRVGGVLLRRPPDDLAAPVIQCIVERDRLDPARIEEVYLAVPTKPGRSPAMSPRMAALLAELAVEVAGVTVDRLCALA